MTPPHQQASGKAAVGTFPVHRSRRVSLTIPFPHSLPKLGAASSHCPDTLTVDNGPELRGCVLDGWADDNGVQSSTLVTRASRPRTPISRASKEDSDPLIDCSAINCRAVEECLNLNWFTSLAEAERIIEDWRVDYNQNRPDSSLNYQIPEEFAANRPFHKPQWAAPLELSEGSAPLPIAHAAEKWQTKEEQSLLKDGPHKRGRSPP
jgi:integrase-like protein